MRAGGVKDLLIFLALQAQQNLCLCCERRFAKAHPTAQQAPDAAVPTRDPSVSGEPLELPSCLGRGSPQDLNGRAGLANKARRRVRFSCRVTEPRWVKPDHARAREHQLRVRQGCRSVLGKGQGWDRGDRDGNGEAAAAAEARGACPAQLLTELQRGDLCVLPCLYVTARKYSQEGVISSKS